MSAFCRGCRDRRIHILALREESGEERGLECSRALWGGRARGAEAGQRWGLEARQAAAARRSSESSPAGDHGLRQLEVSAQRRITKVVRKLKEKGRLVGGEWGASGKAPWRRRGIHQVVSR